MSGAVIRDWCAWSGHGRGVLVDEWGLRDFVCYPCSAIRCSNKGSFLGGGCEGPVLVFGWCWLESGGIRLSELHEFSNTIA